jgi:hypothetical protein
MSTAPPAAARAAPATPASSTTPEELPDRIHRLEDEIAELRDTIARFADIMIGEVKDLRKVKTEAPTSPSTFVGEAGTTANGATSHRPWLLTELLREVGTALRMYFDPRYRVRRATQLLVPLIVALFILNGLFFRAVFTIPILSAILEKIGDIALAVLLYKVVSREVLRYRHVIAQLAAWQDYQGRVTVVSADAPTTPLETD